MMRATFLLSVLLATGCASLEGPEYGPYDPFEGFNRASYGVSDWVDRNALVPVARGYQRVTPDWLRDGISNVFLNLITIDSALNGFLQGKPKRGGTDLARIILNSTIGIGGLINAAAQFGLDYQEEDLGQTLAVAGLTRTRYVYIPFAGPSALRDIPGRIVRAAIPNLLLGDAYKWWMSGIDLLNSRAQALSLTDTRDAAALDPYAFTREAYYQRRKFLIFDGDPPVDDFFDDFDEDY
ncbi:MAG: ABC transporter [Gammaproteobacteria bacterium]|nr:ABC transporter [Gammaproteobacteria bacterium]